MSQVSLVLASNSPRRKELLSLGGWTFHIDPADVDERELPGETPVAYVLRLAEAKARACADTARPGPIMVGADTTVVDGNQILGKPADAAEAVRMLKQLRGRVHQVYTGIALFRPNPESYAARRWEILRRAELSQRGKLNDSLNCPPEGSPSGVLITDLCVTDVPMRDYTDAEIDAYVATGDSLDKAGAYAIQHAGFHPVERLSGCYASVMGLPLCHLTRSLRKLGVEPETDISAACQAHLSYDCPVTKAILRGETAG